MFKLKSTTALFCIFLFYFYSHLVGPSCEYSHLLSCFTPRHRGCINAIVSETSAFYTQTLLMNDYEISADSQYCFQIPGCKKYWKIMCNFLGFSLCDSKIIMKVEMIFTIE